MKNLSRSLLLAAALACASLAAGAAGGFPDLYADDYPATSLPDSITLSANGGAAKSCQMVASTNGAITPKCDLAPVLTGFGSYSLVMTATKTAYSCVQTTGGAICTAAGSASSIPFALTWKAPDAATPKNLRLGAPSSP